jgi:hypothetical protein
MASTHDAPRCSSCRSDHLARFSGEVAIHFPGLEGLDIPIVWVFPELVICMDCGIAQFAVPEANLRQLVRGKAAGQ